jgi:metal-responsive CopG/Arc/MetJ family transcriptional regulator
MIVSHTVAWIRIMAAAKIAITLDKELVERLDKLVEARQFDSRSRAVQEAVREKLDRIDRTRLARECKKLNPRVERKMAELGMESDSRSWPEY